MNAYSRKIIHIDMDCFYASIEIRDNPSLADKPVAVGGSAARRGVLTTCNYVARQFGLHSAMPTAQALKRCPDLVLLPVNMPLYKQVSQQIQRIFYDYTHLVEPLSLDEAYLDVTDCTQCRGSATWIAQEIRQKIRKEVQLTASAGVAPLKFLAKIASDQNKPNGQFVINPHEVASFIHALPLSKIPGVGKVTTQRLLQMGLHTCADVQRLERSVLFHRFGKMGQRIWAFSYGIDEREVQPYRERKSVSVERTLLNDIQALDEGKAVVAHLYPDLLRRIRQSDPKLNIETLRKIGVKLKFDDFHVTILEKSAMQCSEEQFMYLLEAIWQRRQGRRIRLIGLQVNLPAPKVQQQTSLW